MFKKHKDENTYWPSLTDLVLAVLLLVLILWGVESGMRSVWDSLLPRLQPGEIAVGEKEWNERPVPNPNYVSVKRSDLDELVKKRPDEIIVKAADWEKRVIKESHQVVVNKEAWEQRVEVEPDEMVVKKAEWEKRVIKEFDQILVKKAAWEQRVEIEPDEMVVKKAEWEKRVELKPGEVIMRDAPLVIPLEEASGYAFDPGHAELPAGFEDRLRQDIVPKIKKMVEDYPIDVMEIIGHTDGTPKSGSSNLDSILMGFEFGPSSSSVIGRLQAGSNADLGLARALSVASFLNNEFGKSKSPQLVSLVCRAYSGAQLIAPKSNMVRGAKNEDIPSRRRIELRFTRKSKLDAEKPAAVAE